MRSVPPNGKLPELVCEFSFLEWQAEASSPSGARSGARARSAFPSGQRAPERLRASALLGTTEGDSPAFILVIYFGPQGCADPRVT